jgi:hypothetical protein
LLVIYPENLIRRPVCTYENQTIPHQFVEMGAKWGFLDDGLQATLTLPQRISYSLVFCVVF